MQFYNGLSTVRSATIKKCQMCDKVADMEGRTCGGTPLLIPRKYDSPTKNRSQYHLHLGGPMALFSCSSYM